MNPKAITLVPLISLDIKSKMKLREIRNEEGIRKWMYTDHIISVNEHLKWMNRLKQDHEEIVFAVVGDKHSPLGVVSINSIDRLHKKANWTFYLTETARGGLGATLEYSFISFIFESLGIEKLNCEVIEGNDIVVNLHKKFLFQEEGFRRSNIIKNGVRVGVHFLGLTKNDWLAGKNEIQKRYKEIFEKYSLSIRWTSN